jgi:hypothetical protein
MVISISVLVIISKGVYIHPIFEQKYALNGRPELGVVCGHTWNWRPKLVFGRADTDEEKRHKIIYRYVRMKSIIMVV